MKNRKKNSRSKTRLKQVAALPYRVRSDGSLDVLVITSRTTRRLIVPKGWPMEGKPHHVAAGIEADEEAGVKGRISKKPIGSFSYKKDMGTHTASVQTLVFPLKVQRLKSSWKEKRERKRKWMDASRAAEAISDQELGELVRQCAPDLAGNT